MSKKLTLKRSYERVASIEPFYTGGAICLSRDGSVMCCTCAGEIKIVDVETGAVKSTIDADVDHVTALALAPNAQELVSAGRDFLVKTWDTNTGEKVRSWKSGQGNSYVQRLAYDDTGTLAAGGCSDFVVRVWDAERGFATHNLKGHGALITSILFGPAPRSDPNKLMLFSGAEDGEVRVWSLANKVCKSVLKTHDSAVTAMAIHVPTRSLLTGGRDRIVAVWDLRKMQSVHSIPVYDTIEGLAIVPVASSAEATVPDVSQKKQKRNKHKSSVEHDEEPSHPAAVHEPRVDEVTAVKDIEFVTAGEKGLMKRWRVGGGKCVASEQERAGAVSYAAVLQDHARRTVMGVTVDNSLLFFEPSTLKVKKLMVGHNEEVLDAAFASESVLAVCTNSDHLRVFDTATQSCRLLHGHTNVVLAVDCCAGSGLLTTVSKDRLVRTWHVATARCVGVGEGHVDAIGAVAVGPRHGELCCSGSGDLTIKVWDLKPAQRAAAALERGEEGVEPAALGAQRTWRAHDKDINSLAMSPNDSLVASGSQDKKVKVWDVHTGELKATCIGHKRGVWCVKMSPVDKVVASSSADGTLKVWSIANGACLKTMEGHEGSVLKLAFVCSGMQLLSTGSDGLMKLWTIKTSVCVNTFDHHTDKVWALAVAPSDDTMVVTGGADSVVNMWDDKTAELEETSRQESEEKLLLEQDLANALRAKDYRRAAMLAFQLQQPFRLLRVVQDVLQLEDKTALAQLVTSFNPDQLNTCLLYLRDWNTTARNAPAAQALLLALLQSFRVEELCKCSDIKAVVEALVPYTERHFERLEEALQRTYALDFTLHAMRDALGADDGADDDAEMLAWGIDTAAFAVRSEGEEEEEEEEERVNVQEMVEVEEEEEDGAEMDGWGSWAGPAGDDDEEEEEGVRGGVEAGEEEETEDRGLQEESAEDETKSKKKRKSNLQASATAELATPKRKDAGAAERKAATTGKKKKQRASISAAEEEEEADEDTRGGEKSKKKKRLSLQAVPTSSTPLKKKQQQQSGEDSAVKGLLKKKKKSLSPKSPLAKRTRAAQRGIRTE